MKSFMRFIPLIFLLTGLFAQAAKASQYEISLFRQYYSEFQNADQRYRMASGGSYQEQIANQQRQVAAQAAKNIIRAPNTFQQMMAAENELLLLEFSRGYQSASSGSLAESIFDTARRAAADALPITATLEIQSAYDYQQALQLTLTADRKYQSASSGSLLETAYNQVRSQGYEISKQKVREFASYSLQDFRQGEAVFLEFSRQYQSASSGSKLENFYDDGRRTLHGRTLELFRFQIGSFAYPQLISIEAEYGRKYQSASSGTLAEDLYRAIRDEARARLGGQVPQPYPPQPQPYPPQMGACEVHSGANANGQLLYRVMTRSGAVIATVFNAGEAARIAHTDVRCFQ